MNSTTESLRDEIDNLQAELDAALDTIEELRAKLADLRRPMGCGHPGAAVFTDDDLGGPGTSYCGWCAAEAGQYHAGEKAGEAKWFQKWASMARDAYAGSEDLAALYLALFCEPWPAPMTAAELAAKVRTAWAAGDAPCWEE